MEGNVENKKSVLVLAIIMYSAFYIGGHIPYGQLLAYLSVLVLVGYAVLCTRGIIRIRFSFFVVYMGLFCVYCFASVLWADNAIYALNKGYDLLLVTVLTLVVYNIYQETGSIDPLLKIIMWLGFVMSMYAILYYGWSTVMLSIIGGIRISNDAINSNTLGMMSAFAILINIYYILDRKIKWWTFFSVPSLIVLLASESRKAIFIIVAGVFVLFVLKNIDEMDPINSILRVVGVVILLLVVVYFLSQSNYFDSVNKRIQSAISAFSGTGGDYSTLARIGLIQVGMDLFRKNPILGVGADNAKIYGGIAFGKENYYLHNNFVELLANGGIVAFVLYYSIYLFVGIRLLKNRNFRSQEYNICLVMFVIRLILDYGMVSYDDRYTYVFILMLYMKTEIDKKKKELEIE